MLIFKAKIKLLKKFALIINKYFSSCNFAIQKKKKKSLEAARLQILGVGGGGGDQMVVNYTCYLANHSFKSMAKSFNHVLGMCLLFSILFAI